MLSGSAFAHIDQTKYLGVMLNSTGSFKCSFDHVNIKFYRWFIVTYFRAKHVGTELVCIQLLKSILCPCAVLSHAVEIFPLTKTDSYR